MPIPAQHTDLFHNSDTSDKILIFQQLLESQDLTAMEALALLNTIHQELQQSEGHQPEVYVRYARMMELFRKRMPELQEEVTRKWSELQFILKAREPKGEILADDPEPVEKEQKGRPDYKSSGRVLPARQPRPLSEKTGRPIRQDNGDVITGGAETEEEGMEQGEETEFDKEENIVKKENMEKKEQESDDEEQDEEENISGKEDIKSEKAEELESEPDEQDGLEIEENETKAEEAETEQEVEEQVEEKEVELKSETQNRESEVSISEEGIEKEISHEEEGDHLAGEAAEAAAEQEQHGSEPPLELDEEEPPMESTGG